MWGSGNQVGTRLAALAVEQSEDGGDGPGVIRYFGDIDAGGFRVPARRWAGQGNSGSGRSCPPGACTTLPSTVGRVSFRDIADQISATISDPSRLLGEQTRFLLAELAALYESDGLLTADDTVVVAARAAWPEYQEHGAYVCQPDRTFRDGLTHFGFYAKGAIQPLVPQIRQHYLGVLT